MDCSPDSFSPWYADAGGCSMHASVKPARLTGTAARRAGEIARRLRKARGAPEHHVICPSCFQHWYVSPVREAKVRTAVHCSACGWQPFVGYLADYEDAPAPRNVRQKPSYVGYYVPDEEVDRGGQDGETP
jgi:hypothetical protein